MDNKLIEKATTYIEKKLAKNNFGETLFTDKKTGCKIMVTPCSYGSINNIKDVDYFLVTATHDGIYGTNNIKDLAEQLCSVEEIINASNAEKSKLTDFFKTHLDGKLDDLELANSVSIDLYNGENEDNVCSKYNIDRTELIRLKALADDFQFYSDWHKGIYGYRPHIIM